MSELKKFNVDQFAGAVFTKSLAATKTSNSMPEGDDFSDASVASSDFGPGAQRLGKRLVELMERTGSHMSRRKKQVVLGESAPFDTVLDVVDGWLESVDLTLDRMNGVATEPEAVNVTHEQMASNVKVIRAANVLRPQLRFVPPVDNSAATPFVPVLTAKPHAVAPLAEVFKPSANAGSQSAISAAMQSHLTARLGLPEGAVAPHAYEAELQALTFDGAALDQSVPERKYASFTDMPPYTWINTVAGLEQLITTLSKESEIAIDLEQHFFRSYQGFLCLMQVSTRSENFLVDVLELRPHMQRMNEVTCNPDIVKVLHGADYDVLWLQRDFGVYVVNMFDTGQAARVLELPKKGLAYLLQHYCGVTADKQYQLADWRIRPLPKEMQKYAVQDTHYLLYVYDVLRNQLIQRGAHQVLAVFNRSRQLCLQRYTKPAVPTAASIQTLYNKLRAEPLEGRHMDLFVELVQWRDEVARREDESEAFVLPSRMLYAIALQMPTSTEHLLSLCVPVPPLARAHAHELTALVHRVKEGTLNAPGVRGFHAIAALLRPDAPQPAARTTSSLPPPAVSVVVHPSNASPRRPGVPPTSSRLFRTVEEDSAHHEAALAASLDAIGRSFDPLFAARVAEAAGVTAQEEGGPDDGNAAASRKRGPEERPQDGSDNSEGGEDKPEDELPKSLAEIHQMTQRNKRSKRKKKKKAKTDDAAAKGSPLRPDANVAGSTVAFVKRLGWQQDDIAPRPSGTNRVAYDGKKEKKQLSRNQQGDETQGFQVTQRVRGADRVKKNKSTHKAAWK